MNKKTLIPIIALLLLVSASGAFWYFKARNSSSQQPGQSQDEQSYYDETLYITDIDTISKAIIGNRVVGTMAGKQIKIMANKSIFYDADDKIVDWSYFRPGMLVWVRGYIFIKEPDVFYAEFIHEAGRPPLDK